MLCRAASCHVSPGGATHVPCWALPLRALALTLPFCALDVVQPAAVQTQGQVNDENRRPQRRRSGNSGHHLEFWGPCSALCSCLLPVGDSLRGPGSAVASMYPVPLGLLFHAEQCWVSGLPAKATLSSHREQTNKEPLQRAKPSN